MCIPHGSINKGENMDTSQVIRRFNEVIPNEKELGMMAMHFAATDPDKLNEALELVERYRVRKNAGTI
jgi:hypothetical protein